MHSTDVLILGAGAAGLMCAIHAGRRGRSVMVLERNAKIGEKIRISGGGRCNFTNRIVRPDQFISSNPDFVRSPLARYSADTFIAYVGEHGIAYHEKTLGQLFCDKSATEIIEMLRSDCQSAGVSLVTGCTVDKVDKGADAFEVQCENGETYTSTSLVVATGGLSVPKIGATDFGYRIARQFGVGVEAVRPGLVPLTLAQSDLAQTAGLSGVSVAVRVSCNGAEFREAMLFTHRGLSGPAILQISSYWREGDSIMIDLMPDIDTGQLLLADHSRGTLLHTLISPPLTQRLAKMISTLMSGNGQRMGGWMGAGVDLLGKPVDLLDKKTRLRIASMLHSFTITPDGTEGYEKAEVTLGGVSTTELSSNMEVKRVPGLYFVGEVVDVTGWLGGFNFQWAWSSGAAAGRTA